MCLPQSAGLKTIPNSSAIVPNADRAILWHIREDKLTADMDKYRIILAFENGFKILAHEFHPIQFKSTGNKEEASILIGFYKNGDKDLPSKFGGNVLAYAYANYNNFAHSSDMFFNDAYRWGEMDKAGQEYNLKKVFVHEAMHALGFEHSEIKEDILFWQYQTDDTIFFSDDTKAAIRALYGQFMNGGKENAKEIIDFCKNVINFRANQYRLPIAVFVSALKYFNLQIPNRAADIRKTVIDYLDGK